MNIEEITAEKFDTRESAIAKHGTDRLIVGIFSKQPLNLPCCNLEEDMIEQQVRPIPLTKILLKLEAITDELEVWYQFINMGEI